MKKLITNKMGIEAKTLWELSKKSRLTGPFAQLLRDHIQSIKYDYMNSTEDALTTKARKFKKSGTWGKHFTREELPKMVYDTNKKPYDLFKGEWVSVELELIMKSRDAETNFVTFVRSKGYSRYVTIKDDGSLRLGRESQCDCGHEGQRGHRSGCRANSYGKEIVLTFRYGNWDFVKDICGFLNRNRCTVNQTCGMHVHFDCRTMTPDQVTTAGLKVAGTIQALKAILPRSRQDNQYCAVPINQILEERADGRVREVSSRDRYAFVNLHAYARHKTIEFRGHSGTVDAEKIINWIKILRTIMDNQGVFRADNVQRLMASIQFEDSVKEYIIKRAAKFSDPALRRGGDDVYEDDSNTHPPQEAPVSGNNVEQILRDLTTMLMEANQRVAQTQAAMAAPVASYEVAIDGTMVQATPVERDEESA